MGKRGAQPLAYSAAACAGAAPSRTKNNLRVAVCFAFRERVVEEGGAVECERPGDLVFLDRKRRYRCCPEHSFIHEFVVLPIFGDDPRRFCTVFEQKFDSATIRY